MSHILDTVETVYHFTQAYIPLSDEQKRTQKYKVFAERKRCGADYALLDPQIQALAEETGGFCWRFVRDGKVW